PSSALAAAFRGGLAATPETVQLMRCALRWDLMRAAVIGGGSWGTALASVLGNNGHDVTIWSFEQDVAEAIATRRENPKYMPGVQLPQSVTATHDLPRSLAGAELVLAVHPSHVTRPPTRQALPSLPEATPTVTAPTAT